MNIDINGIILGLFTLLASCAWFINWRKDKQEAKGLQKDNRMKDMDLAKKYVDEFNLNIVVPLQQRVQKLETQQEAFQDAIDSIDSCSHRDGCPVIRRLRKQPKGE